MPPADRRPSLEAQALQELRARNFDAALALYQRIFQQQRRKYGRTHPTCAATLRIIATLHELLGRQGRVTTALREATNVDRRVSGPVDPQYAVALNELALACEEQGNYTRALTLHQEVLAIQKCLHGTEHPEYATALNNLAWTCAAMGQYQRALRLYEEALSIKRRAFGRNHLDYATVLNNMALVLEAVGNYKLAADRLEEALKIQERLRRKSQWEYVATLTNLGLAYAALGKQQDALRFYKAALDRANRLRNRPHLLRAKILNNMGVLYRELGDNERALQLHCKALRIVQRARGEFHPQCATTRNNIAAVYKARGEYEAAARECRAVLRIRRATVGVRHRLYATALNNLAGIYKDTQDLRRARRCYEMALEIQASVYGRKHPEYATTLSNIAAVDQALGRYRRAERLLRTAIGIRKQLVGETDPEYAWMLANLGALKIVTGELDEAQSLLRKALGAMARIREEVIAAQNERQRLALVAKMRWVVSLWVTTALALQLNAETIYEVVWEWKGVVFDELRRQMRASWENETARALLGELQTARAQWLTVLSAPPEQKEQLKAWRTELRRLRTRKDELEEKVAELSVSRQANNRDTGVGPAQLIRRLANGTVFVDFFTYAHCMTEIRPVKVCRKSRRVKELVPEDRLLAFVVRRGRKIQLVQLGPVKTLSKYVDQWRGTLFEETGTGRTGKEATGTNEALKRLDAQLGGWLRSSLKWARRLVVGGDGPLWRFPLAALADGKGGYLVEKLPISYVVSGRHLLEVLRKKAGAQAKPHQPKPRWGRASTLRDGGNRPRADGLLLVGGVQYGGHHVELPGTAEEIAVVAREFRKRGRVERITGAEATKARFIEKLHQGWWRYVHLATHGGFCPPEKVARLRVGRSMANDALVDREVSKSLYDPLAYSHLVFAVEDGRCGRLTAEEVLGMDLRGVELAVLSACNTGLGEVADGEGVMGLQRSFHGAGVMTVVSSLWEVDDAAALVLMEEFYRGLWQVGLGPAQALRQAQLVLLREPQRVERRAKQLMAKRRAHQPTTERTTTGVHRRPGRPSPAIWAAFIVSGAW